MAIETWTDIAVLPIPGAAIGPSLGTGHRGRDASPAAAATRRA